MNEHQRQQLIREIQDLAEQAIFGTLSETYRCCGNPKCRCHSGGPKHGPHVYISYRGSSGKTTGYYVPLSVQNSVRRGIEAWDRLQGHVRQLAMANKERLIPPKLPTRRKKTAAE
jgi:hypothetical protein